MYFYIYLGVLLSYSGKGARVEYRTVGSNHAVIDGEAGRPGKESRSCHFFLPLKSLSCESEGMRRLEGPDNGQPWMLIGSSPT